MIYTAPRQIIFAVIILISFCLHSLFLVYSTESQIADAREQKGGRILTELIDESAVAMSYTDRVSLGVIAKRYAGEYDVTRLIILDTNEKILVQTGDAPLQDGTTITKVATHKNVVVGTAVITMKATSKSEIVKELWQFILVSLITHLFIWMAYNLVARPTKEQIKALSRDIHEHYFAHYRLESGSNQEYTATDNEIYEPTRQLEQPAVITSDEDKPLKVLKEFITNKFNRKTLKSSEDTVVTDNLTLDKEVPTTDIVNKSASSKKNDTFSRKKLTNDIASFIAKKSQQLDDKDLDTPSSEKESISDTTSQPSTDEEKKGFTNNFLKNNLLNNHFSNKNDNSAANPADSSFTLATKSGVIEELQISIHFVDPHGLVDKLSDEISTPYYQLCTQLLNHACDQLLKHQILKGVSIAERPIFGKQGATLTIIGDDENKLILAAPLLAELYQILNGILYEKHRELRKFALPVAISITIPANSANLAKFVKRHAEAHDIVLLLSSSSVDYLKDSMKFSNISHPRSVLERECVYLDDVEVGLQKILFKVRNRVLEGD